MIPQLPLCMTPRIRWRFGLLVCVVGVSANAATTVTPGAADAGGGRATGAVAVVDVSLGGIVGIPAAGVATNKSGYVGQLYDLVAIQVTANPTSVNETAARQLVAGGLYDDGTRGSLSTNPAWGVVSGPLTGVDGGGLATAGIVYENTPASAFAAQASVTGTTAILVLNVDNDDYQTYAGDGLPDGWQVAYFGIDNADAAPALDPDGDRFKNADEYAADTVPTNIESLLQITSMACGTSGVRVAWIGGVWAQQYLEVRSDLSDTGEVWSAIFTNTAPTASATNYLDRSAAGTGRGYYRIRAVR